LSNYAIEIHQQNIVGCLRAVKRQYLECVHKCGPQQIFAITFSSFQAYRVIIFIAPYILSGEFKIFVGGLCGGVLRCGFPDRSKSTSVQLRTEIVLHLRPANDVSRMLISNGQINPGGSNRVPIKR
jgi:hypothetical protein